MEQFIALYAEAGMIGVVGAMFVYMVYQNAKRSDSQAESIAELQVINKDRRHEDTVKEINDLSDVMMEVKGSVSRINGKWLWTV